MTNKEFFICLAIVLGILFFVMGHRRPGDESVCKPDNYGMGVVVETC